MSTFVLVFIVVFTITYATLEIVVPALAEWWYRRTPKGREQAVRWAESEAHWKEIIAAHERGERIYIKGRDEPL